MSKITELDETVTVYIVGLYNYNQFSVWTQTYAPSKDSASFVVEKFDYAHKNGYSEEQLTRLQLAQLDTAEEEVRKELNDKMLQFKTTRESMLAITHTPEEPVDGVPF